MNILDLLLNFLLIAKSCISSASSILGSLDLLSFKYFESYLASVSRLSVEIQVNLIKNNKKLTILQC